LRLYTDICKLIGQVAPPTVGLAAKPKLFSVVTFNLAFWSLDLKWDQGLPVSPDNQFRCRKRLPSCQFSAATPFHSRLWARHGTETDRDDGHQRL